ncbi:ubiquinol cytochrome reductase transmembrane region domain-containing protein [Ditylenchus destructor]|uniref:Ubiquinol cytochrome reductase transmembrane region domain-containing protein n=1 Tax=Ditylenchus destructor TaxID=166010 RepID=A0AAD4N2H1_9BILA|nr:ubiquinol cytochrome reductase transmembrane region domain-containing protein [Ditylenchus destructor]
MRVLSAGQAKLLLAGGGQYVSSLSGASNVAARRFAHSDVVFPNFEKYRHDSTKDPNKSSRDSEDDRRALPNIFYYGVGGMLTLHAGKEIVQTVVRFKAMPADQLALATIEVNLNDIPEGKCKTYEWRGKPVFVRHRNEREIKSALDVNVSDLRHPQHDNERVKKPEWSVLIGVCTHLGCVPISGAGDFGGYFCPCHGSHYDTSGRIRKGPAPLNLHIPEYNFVNDETIVVEITCKFDGGDEKKQFYLRQLSTQDFKIEKCGQSATTAAELFDESYGSGANFYSYLLVISIFFSVATILIYLFWWNLYVSDDRIPVIDLAVTVLLAFAWLLGTFCFSITAGRMEEITEPENVKKLVEKGGFCGNATSCDVNSYAVYAPLTVSTIAGISCVLLYFANVWFCYKETANFRSRNSHTVQMPQDPYTLE